MQRRTAWGAAVAVADEYKGTRHHAKKGAEVFGDHHGLHVAIHLARPHDSRGRSHGRGHTFGPIDRGRELMGVLECAFGAVGAADANADLAHAFFQQGLHLGRVAARVALDDHVGRNRIADAIGDELGARDDRRHARVQRARDDGL